nr:DUF4230 domain-containing protein [Glutamicibacter sp. FBE19]
MLEKFKRFLVRVTLSLVALVVIVGVTLAGAHYFGNPFDALGASKNTRVLYSIRNVEEVALLSLGVQEIVNASEDKSLFNVAIPGTTKTSNVQFSFQAKLGIDGQNVKVEDAGSNGYMITIPKFEFIGMENLDIQVLNEENGVLSWVTPDVDKDAMLAEVVNADLQDKYIENNEQLLRQQAENFYRGLTDSVAPDATVEFVFSDN